MNQELSDQDNRINRNHSRFNQRTINNCQWKGLDLIWIIVYYLKYLLQYQYFWHSSEGRRSGKMRFMLILCFILMGFAIFGDLTDAKKVQGDKKTKEIKSSEKIDKTVKHHKEKYLQGAQKAFEGKKDKREAKQTETSNVVEESGKAGKYKRKCNNPEGCSKAAGKQEVPNKKQRKIEQATQNLKKLPKEKVQKIKPIKTKAEKLSKNQNEKFSKKSKKAEEIPVDNEENIQADKKHKKNKISKIEKTESVVADKKSKKENNRPKRSADENELLDEPEVAEIIEEIEKVEESCDKVQGEEQDIDHDVKSEDDEKEVNDKHEAEEEPSIVETL